MAAYVIARVLEMKDPARFEEYRSGVGPVVERYGGKFLVKGGEAHALEGDWRPRMAVIEFESVARARAWYDSEEYRPLRELRQRSADVELSIVEGV